MELFPLVLTCVLVGVLLGPKWHPWMCSAEYSGGDMGLLHGRISIPAVLLWEDLDSMEIFPRGDGQVWGVISSGQLPLPTEHSVLCLRRVHFCGAKAPERVWDEQDLHCLPVNTRRHSSGASCLVPAQPELQGSFRAHVKWPARPESARGTQGENQLGRHRRLQWLLHQGDH